MSETTSPTWEMVARHIRERSAALWRLPAADLDVDPHEPSAGIRVPDRGQDLPDVAGYQNLLARRVYVSGGIHLELRVLGANVLADGFRLLMDVAVELSSGRVDFAQAVAAALHRLQDLLTRRGTLSMEREIGLWGELHVLQRAARTLGALAALQAWQGGDLGGEHDFTFDRDDVEVKTTAAESRLHRITTLTQLQPVAGRPLWLLSVRITRSQGPGSRSLVEQLAYTRDVLGDLAHRLDDRLVDIPPPSSEWSASWRLRARPDMYEVDASFPGLTSDALKRAGIDTVRISRVEQTIDLEGWPASSGGLSWLVQHPTQGEPS